tara:strand:+ start:23890 stop:24063 length:174 start_codon:yes stop_codon:yes gene_type:complete
MTRENEVAWALHTAAKLLGEDYTIQEKTVTTRTTIHDEVVIEYNHRKKEDDATDSTQ